jgi:hypothetical protein
MNEYKQTHAIRMLSDMTPCGLVQLLEALVCLMTTIKVEIAFRSARFGCKCHRCDIDIE